MRRSGKMIIAWEAGGIYNKLWLSVPNRHFAPTDISLGPRGTCKRVEIRDGFAQTRCTSRG